MLALYTYNWARLFFATGCLILLCGLGPSQARSEEASEDGGGNVMRRFAASHCVECHGRDDPEGNLVLEGLAFDEVSEKSAESWMRILEAIKFAEMPPPGAKQPDPSDTKKAADWLQERLAAAGHELDIDHRMQQPSYANLLNHDKLFDGSQTGPAFSPPRLWRLHPSAYELFLESFGRQLKEGGPLSKPFTVGDGKGTPSNYAALVQADSATLGQLMLNCRQVATWQTTGFTKLKKDNRTKKMVEKRFLNRPDAFTAIIESAAAPTDQQLAAAVEAEFDLVLSRQPTATEAMAYEKLLRDAIRIGGNEPGLHTLAMAVLLRPESIYRMEVGLGETDEHGRRMLSPYELAHAISFALTDLPPDQLLLGEPKPRDRSRRPQPPSLMDLANEGKLKTREDVSQVLEQIWNHDGVDKVRVLRFFREFFGYHAAETVFKGDRANRAFAPRFLVKDADDLVQHLVDNDKDVLKELLTTDKFFVQWPGSVSEYERRIKYITSRLNKTRRKDVNNKYFFGHVEKGLRPIPQANPTWRQTVRFYNLDESSFDYPLEQPFAMPARQRVGILTHPAWLVAWSGNFQNDPIRRGKWIQDHLLAGSIPEVPITVNAQVPEDPHKTLRQRLNVTRETYCWQCHQKMEPLGLPFEAFTDFGRHRDAEGLGLTKALGKPKATAPVDTTGEIIASGDSNIDGKVKDVHELMHRLANSERVRQSFVRHAFRYWMGRNERLSDSPTLIGADRAYVENSGSFKSLVFSLLTSDSFLYRK